MQPGTGLVLKKRLPLFGHQDGHGLEQKHGHWIQIRKKES